ncbi:lipoprotein insertase outer membrane protein LolB [Kangiella sp. TOML190]|uniref:lipoprotein insertase outer membrane protein LolB n=1 Tax=Kangiella sp. TOML190 TaxID=2931351 RepID=UPI00203FD1D3|nr:lipoprotein insertase outer membrane protein LolB [Kangiella sp. TOML190]
MQKLLNLKALFIFCCLLAISACDQQRVLQETTEWDDPLWQAHYQALKPIQNFSLKGRIGISNPRDSFSSNFRWQQNAHQDFQFRMYGALGNTYLLMNSKINWSTIETGDDQFFEGPNAEQLVANSMGWQLPLNYLSDWIKGVPTGVGRDKIKINADGTLQSLTYPSGQRIFQVSFERYGQFSGKAMPTKIRILEADNKLLLSIRDWTF